MTNDIKRKLGSKEFDRSGYEKKIATCDGCGKEEEGKYKYIGTGLTEIWQIGGDKSSRKSLCAVCLEDPTLNPRREAL
jgi:hypothetical protein